MDAVGAERDRRLDVVVDDEGRAELAKGLPGRDDLGRRVLQPQLDDGRAALDRRARGLEVLDERVQPHAIDARAAVERRRVERRERVVEADVERAGPPRIRAASSPATPKAASASAAASSGSLGLAARKQPVIAVDMQPVPVTVREQLVAVRDREHALAVGDVVDRAGHGSDDAERRAASRGSSAGVAAGADRLDAAHLGLDADERRDLARVAAQDGHVDLVEDPLRRLRPVARRAGADRVEDDRDAARSPPAPASSIASTQCGESVPMLITSAPARPTISSTSSRACAITGSAPSASVAFAVSFMTT